MRLTRHGIAIAALIGWCAFAPKPAAAQIKRGSQPGSNSQAPNAATQRNEVRVLPPTDRLPPIPPAPNELPPGTNGQGSPTQKGGRGQKPSEDISPGLTLDELITIVLNNSPAIREALTQAAAARGKAYQAGLYPNPVVATASPQLAGKESQYNVFASQDIVTKGKLNLDSSAAQRTAREAELAAVRARFDVLTTVRQRFFVARWRHSGAEILQELLAIAQESKSVGDRLLKGGVGTRTDVLLLEIEFDRSSVSLQNAETMVEANKKQLVAALGVPDLAVSRLRGDLQAKLPAYDAIAVEQGVVSQNALARIAEVEIERSQILLRRAEVEPFPNINFLGGMQYQASEPRQQGLYQLTMTVPLWNRNQGNIRAAQASIGTANAQLGRVRNDLAGQTAMALGRLHSAQQLVERYEQQILPKARETQSQAQELYTQGELDFLHLMQAQRTLTEANLAYIGAQEIRWTAAAEVAGLLQSEQFP